MPVSTTDPDEKQARDNKLTIEDMAGGTFTISNVINFPEFDRIH